MKKGFTLIELLVVIAILAILTAAVVVVLNPAQLLAQSRDTQRLSDLQSVQAAIVLDLATATGTVSLGIQNRVTLNPAPSDTPCQVNGGGLMTTNAITSVDGNGWIGVDLRLTSGGAPLSVLPLDPTNSGSYWYAYCPSSSTLTFEIFGRLESAKYRDRMMKDGGTHNVCAGDYTNVAGTGTGCLYEIGTAPGLAL